MSVVSNLITDASFTVINGAADALPVIGATYRTAATSKGQMDGRLSRQWSSRPDDQRFTSLQDLRDFVAHRTELSRASVIDTAGIRVLPDAETNNITLDLGNGERPMEMSHWSFGQICQLTGIPAEYLRKLPAKLAAINLQHGTMAYAGNQLQAYTYHNGSDTVRSFNGAGYGRLFDLQFIDQLLVLSQQYGLKTPGQLDWASQSGGTVAYNPYVDTTKDNTTLFASDRDFFVFLCDDTRPIEIGKLADGSPDLVFKGIMAWNSEVGAATGGYDTFLLRGVCCNRNLWGCEQLTKFKLRHTKNAPVRFDQEAQPMLNQFVNGSSLGIISKVRVAKETIVASNDDERKDFLRDKANVTASIADRALKAVLQEEGHPAASVWDMVQGLTATARKMQHQDARVDLEEKAGKLMSKLSA
jgi:hypothetical protein